MQAHRPIGIFDSGVGGLTVVKAVMEHLPNEKIIYLGDTARVPYGSRGQDTIIRYAQNAARFLLSQNVKILLIACNTASAAALPQLESELSIPVLGTVKPGAEIAVKKSRSKTIGVAATLATVRSGAYTNAITHLDANVKVFSQACPLLVPIIEEGWTDPQDTIAKEVMRRYLAPMQQQAPIMDTLVLGCTHYPLLKSVFANVAQDLWEHPIHLVDSAVAMAHAAEEELTRLNLLNQSKDTHESNQLECFVTDEARVVEIGTRFLGRKLQEVKVIDL